MTGYTEDANTRPDHAHIWVRAGLDPDDPQVCARCNAER